MDFDIKISKIVAMRLGVYARNTKVCVLGQLSIPFGNDNEAGRISLTAQPSAVLSP